MDYHKGDTVPKSGAYRCFRCGNRYEFKSGGIFPACRCGHGAYRVESEEPVISPGEVAVKE